MSLVDTKSYDTYQEGLNLPVDTFRVTDILRLENRMKASLERHISDWKLGYIRGV
jgi:hypothetical protein